MRRFSALLMVLIVLPAMPRAGAVAQSFRRGGTELNALRKVTVAADELRPIVVTEFFHHGEIRPDGKNVLVLGRGSQPVASRVLQLGPGDFCRLAFESQQGQTTYDIYYGGEPPEEDAVPAWTNRDGLLLETRKYKQCNPNQLDSVRKAFESSERIGADYVDNVHHSSNPFSLKVQPFLSHYSGRLHIGSAGRYGFFTSSQDASFLLIDGKEVVSHPGRHRPQRQAKPGLRKDIQLSAGAHKFDYYHLAMGPDAIMAAAWEPSPGPPDKAKPQAIPTEAFRTQAVGRSLAGAVQLRELKMVPDFLVNIVGDVPLPDNDQPLIGVAFKDVSPKALTGGGLARWDFGDGQTSEKNDPVHVYLKPGMYTVKLSTGRRTARPLEIANRVYIDRPTLTRKDEKNFHKLDDYLPTLQTYDPSKLDVGSLRQLVEAYQYKAVLVQTPPENESPEAKPDEAAPAEKPNPETTAEQREALRAEVKKWIGKAVEVGKAPFLGGTGEATDADLYALVQLIGPMARDQVGDSKLALEIWKGAAARIKTPAMKGHCLAEAADVAINDLLDVAAAKPLLEAAEKLLAAKPTGPAASRLHFVWGDYLAATGEGKEARKRYEKAEEVMASTKSHFERTAWRGAHSRSTEDFIKSGELARAAEQIHQWQKEFPAEKLDGYMVLMYARYWAGRGMYAQAIAQNEQLQNVAPDSPYADQLLLLTSECELARGEKDRALATLQGFLQSYPGSPLVPVVKDRIRRIEAGELDGPRSPRRKL